MSPVLFLRGALTVCAVCALLPPAAAFAAADLLSDSREIYALLDLTDFGGTALGGPTSDFPAFGATFNEYIGYSGYSPAYAAQGDVYADQLSLFDGNPTFSSLSGNGLATGSANTDFDAISAQVSGETLLSIQFRLFEPHTYTLSGGLTKQGGSGTFTQVRLRPVGGADIFQTTAAGTFDDSGTLVAGDYELIAKASVNRLAGSSTFFDLSASFDDLAFDIEVVPEPQTLALVALAGLIVSRRRRA
jgi:hypothetical protein